MSQLKEYISNNFSNKRPSTCIVNLKKNKDGMLDELEKATCFLNEYYKEISVNQRLHHYLNGIHYAKLCKYCKKPLQIKPFNARISGEFYNGTCDSKECRSKFNGDQSRKGFLEKHGVENISQTPEWREKVKKTNLERRGVEWNTQSKEFQEISRNKSIEKYGVPYPMQNERFFERNVYKRKAYRFPSGKIVYIQGYEWKCLDELILNRYEESDIIVGNIEIAKYTGCLFYEYEGRTHRYYPDIYIISENQVIEVKSTYTVKKDIRINNKRDAVIGKGLKYSLKIY
jgi:hypothetical protein